MDDVSRISAESAGELDSTDGSWEGLRQVAVDVAERTARRVLQQRAEIGDIRAHTRTKSSAVDPVTVVDTDAEDFISAELSRLRPDDGLIGEEGSGRPSLTGVTWIVDPIDGTVNFLYGLPQYAVSIAAAADGMVVAGAVINVATGTLYSAARDGGAVRTTGETEEALEVSQPAALGQALVATGFSYSEQRRRAQAEILTGVLGQVRDIRRMGSAALDLCHLAAGEVDAYYEHGLNSWDFAAGALIAEEAGAVVQTPPLSSTGREGEIVVAASTGIFTEFRELLDSSGARQRMPR